MRLTLAHRAFAIAESLALPAALMPFFLAGVLASGFVTGLTPFTFAQRAFCAAAIFARPAALILPFFGARTDAGADVPKMEPSSLFNASIFSLRSAACRSCAVVNDDN